MVGVESSYGCQHMSHRLHHKVGSLHKYLLIGTVEDSRWMLSRSLLRVAATDLASSLK